MMRRQSQSLQRYVTEDEPLDVYLDRLIEVLERIADVLEASHEQS
jgi:hypothetical protein